MPGRTRRVRLVAVVLCIVTVFFLYERNSARVDKYAEYFTRDTVGGGAVLRKAGDRQQVPLELETEPAYRSGTTYLPAQSTTKRGVVKEPSTPLRTTSTSALPTTSSAYRPYDTDDVRFASKTPAPEQSNRYGDDTDDDEEDLMAYTSVTSRMEQHWSKMKENFPITSTITLPSGSPSPIPRVQKRGRGAADKERLAKIRDACKHAWNGFRTQGWDHDEVKPLSGGGQNSFNGWGATLVDSLDTLWIMGLEKEFEEAVQKVGTIDFTTSSRNDIPLFEVTIRYLGGMLGAYDVSGRKHRILLDKAVELGEILYSAFDTPNRMPETYYQWKPAYASNQHRASTRVVMAEIGTLSLEFTRLAQLTLEPKYYDAIARITNEFEKWQNNTRVPGMWPTDMDASGCRIPVRKAPTPTKPYRQSLLPDSDTIMITSDPVKVDPSVMAKAEQAVEDASQYRNAPSGGVGSIANPAMVDMVGGLRHKMSDDPWMKQESPLHDDSTNHADANSPLPPGAGSPESGVTLENPSVGKRPSDPLLPNAGLQHQKRRLDEFDILHHDINRAETSESTPLTAAEQDLADEMLFDMYQEPEEPEDLCEYQGFVSVNDHLIETFTLGGKSDSTYEYLPKEYLLLGGRVEQYKTMYIDSTKPVIDQLIFRPMTIDNRDILVSGELQVSVNTTDGSSISLHKGRMEHLTCFVGGMFAMGGKIFDLPEHVEIGRKLTDGCVWAYSSMNSGIMPDGASLLVCEDAKNCKWNQTAWYNALDPFGADFRQEQLDDWKETYEIDDIAAWREARAAEEAAEEAAASSAARAAELALATSLPSYTDEEYMHDEELRTVPNRYASGSHRNNKRQSPDSRYGQAPQFDIPTPQPQALPTPSPSQAIFPTLAEDIDRITHTEEDDLWNGQGSFGADPYAEPTPTGPPEPIYTPDPPQTHLEFIKSKLEDDRIPPGFLQIGGNGYILRPEAIESVFYMYRITGEQYWRDVGWKMFLAIETATRSPYGHSSLDDVTKTNPTQTDKMESFWIAETLKYFYLLFDDPETWSLDDWVLNTEAHFFRRPDSSVR